jgi:hypothetical protein
MIQRNFSSLLTGAALALSLAGGIHAGSCNLNVPLQWTINPMYVDGATASAITGDGAPYANGQAGVTAIINVCSGTNDATLVLSSPRNITFDFGKVLASNGNTPSWANGGSVTGAGQLNINNIVFVPAGYTRADEYSFTTRMGSLVPAKGSWNLRMYAPVTDASSASNTWVTTANTPYTSSLVDVHHCPANSTAASGVCAGIVHETWFAYPDPASAGSSATGLPVSQVAALENTSKPTSPLNAGQFSVPFYFVISTIQ